jgi:ABC-type sugar transport system ATPase subunit
VTVLRSGVVVADKRIEETDETELSGLMARSAAGWKPVGEQAQGKRKDEVALSLRDLRLAPGAKPLSLDVHSGEILAVVALAGNGLQPLEDFASGMVEPREGEVLVGRLRLGSAPRTRLRSELLGYMPSEREARGLCLSSTLRDNLLILRRRDFGFRDWLGLRARDEAARDAALAFGVKASPRAAVSSLSGGTRQRLLLARELDRPRSVLLLAEPFQGLDLAAQEEASTLVRELAGRGSAVLLLLSKAEEIIGLADRAIALYRGEIAYEGPVEGEATTHMLLAAMAGASRGSAA